MDVGLFGRKSVILSKDKLKKVLKMKIQYCFDLHMEFHDAAEAAPI